MKNMKERENMGLTNAGAEMNVRMGCVELGLVID